MTSDKYPQLAPRANRSRITSDDKIKIISNLLSANSGLIYIDSDKNLHIGAEVTKIDEQQKGDYKKLPKQRFKHTSRNKE